MNGYVQLTPIPEQFFQNNNVLDRMAKALDGPDPQEVRFAWFNKEKGAFLKWSGLGKEWRYSEVTGFPTKFMVFSGPWAAKDEEPPAIKPRLDALLGAIRDGAVYGDVGTTLGGKPFSTRSRWKVKSRAETSCSGRRYLLPIVLLVLGMAAVLAGVVING